MDTKEVKINRLFFYWLLLSFILVFAIIIIGGLTRLTNSGLSIIEWELFKGVLPPLNDETWRIYFEKYKTIPQYKLLNPNMNLKEFKIIFYWEYFHRLLARIIGLFFLLPFIYFYFTKKIKVEYLKKSLFILILIIIQGAIGWYMVKSGLQNDVTVSHYRLSLHLSGAIIIFCTIFWLIKCFLGKENKAFFKFSKDYLPFQFSLLFILLQIIIGAFVSGLDAGKIYQTWPLMGSSFVPDDLFFKNLGNFLELDNHSLVQFYHRTLAYLIVFYSILLTAKIFKQKKKNLYKPLFFLLLTLFIQIIIGIFTLLSGLNIYLASTHQIMGSLLAISAINLYYFHAK